jgi:hypothetical protein
MRLPDTSSQRWAAAHGACYGGRRRLGKMSIGQYWQLNNRTTDFAYDLLWVVKRLMGLPCHRHGGASLQSSILTGAGINPSWVTSLENERRLTAKKVRTAAFQNGVKIPLGLL